MIDIAGPDIRLEDNAHPRAGGPDDLGNSTAIRSPDLALSVVFTVLDEILILFIVQSSCTPCASRIQHRGRLDAVPFLVVGLIAGAWRVLIVTAQTEYRSTGTRKALNC
ncbi:MAG TPA: hypothetical protein VGG05_28500 [Pseudonocardiaceae bacterium]|jgi:hypothetical protein